MSWTFIESQALIIYMEERCFFFFFALLVTYLKKEYGYSLKNKFGIEPLMLINSCLKDTRMG